MLSLSKKPAALYKLHPVSKDGQRENVFLGTTSNKPSQIRPKWVPQDVVKNVLVITDKDKVPDGVPNGLVIDKTEDTIKSETAPKLYFYQPDCTTLVNDKEKL